MLIESSTCRLSLFYQSLGKHCTSTRLQFSLFKMRKPHLASKYVQLLLRLYYIQQVIQKEFWGSDGQPSFKLHRFVFQVSSSYPFAMTKFHNFKGAGGDCFGVIMRTASFIKSAPECLELQLKRLILSLRKPGTTSWDRVSKGKLFLA